MKWTADKVALLRDLAPRGMGAPAIAGQLGCTVTALQKKAEKLRVSIVRFSSQPRESESDLRARWDKLLPKMKESLRAEIALL